MTSDSRIYVYLQMPGTLEVVTAAYYEHAVDNAVPTGRLVYGRRYMERPDAVALEPFELPLKERLPVTTKLKGVFGALRDASPDSWGRRLIERHLARADLTEVDYLLHSPDDRAGALAFGRGKTPPAPQPRFNQLLQLPQLLAYAQAMDDEDQALDARRREELRQQLDELVNPDTGMGGARPKNGVLDDAGVLWLAKFPARNDRWNYARVEAAMLALAAECGINTPATRVLDVGGHDVLLVRRFDRARVDGGQLRHRMVSGLTLLGADESHTERSKWSYLTLADEVRRRSARPDRDVRELYRRIVFNALISNTDDHPRNHAMIAPGREFELSPAYDLTPFAHASLEKRDLAMTVGRFNRYANRTNLLSECEHFKLPRAEATALIDEVQRTVAARWRPVMRAKGVSEYDCELLAGAFNYPGFEYDPKIVLAQP
jgi:serine/threonine-protein kinase HipA